MKIRRISAAAAFVAVGAVVLAACSNAPGTTTPTATGTGGATAGTATGGTIRVAETNAFTTFNPLTSAGNTDINNKVVEYPTRAWFNYVEGPTLKVVKDPSFGTYEVLSQDPLKVKYTVNKGVTWSDGVQVDASDLLLAWAVDSGHYNSPGADGKPSTKDDVTYFDYAGDTSTLALTSFPEISSDNMSMTLTYSKPAADWEIALTADEPAHVVAAHAGLADTKALDDLFKKLADSAPKATAADPDLKKVADFWNTGFDTTTLPSDPSLFLSSGPFIVQDIQENQSVTLVPNTKYTGDLKPHVDQIVMRTISDPTAAVQALKNGEVDVVSPQSSADTLTALKALSGIKVITGDQLAFDHVDLTFNNKGPFDPATYGGDATKALKVRQAFLKTIPRQQILDAIVTPQNPNAKVLNSQIFVPAQAAYAPTVAKNGSADYSAVDIPGAQKLLQEAGVTKPTVKIMYNKDNPNRLNSYTLIAQSAAQAGFNVVDDGQPKDKWGGILGDGTYDASIFGWIQPGVGVSGTPQLYKTNGGGNYNGYSNPKVDQLCDQLTVELDSAKQTDLQSQIDSLLFPDAYGLPLFQSPGVDAVSDKVGGMDKYNSTQSGVWWNTWEWTISK
ncbi:MAG: ABC transporter substrate-binding protein [Cellulomonas sp. 73-92]|uniref:ABC transporter family substrate-binding protein n=1 Tax=Cellulomonas sp. 73-92 TaxID=1895740 RepID=UPI000929FB2E|nr:ABC transporter family substrate-binding protein [Cellulomonas sp. 73-92]OJV83485.1 MAG: ABC transporter substrate-binding protein [Cellulomonas sp. 73-92]